MNAVEPSVEEVRGAWSIDPAHSRVGFSVKHAMVTTVRGSFPVVRGSIRVEDVGVAAVDVEIDVSSIDTGQQGRDDHLRSPDFFDVETHPSMRFVSTGIEDLEGDEFVLVGDLTIRGVTRPVRIDVESSGVQVDHRGATRAGFEGRTTISRAEFGLTWNVALEAGGVLVSDRIKIELDVSAVKDG